MSTRTQRLQQQRGDAIATALARVRAAGASWSEAKRIAARSAALAALRQREGG